ICFGSEVGACNGLSLRSSNHEGHSHWPHMRGLWGEREIDCEFLRRYSLLLTRRAKQQNPRCSQQTVSCKKAAFTPAPCKAALHHKSRQTDYAALGNSSRCHAQVQAAGFSPTGGNTW